MQEQDSQKGNILIINTGSTTTKLGYYSDGIRVFDEKLEHTADEVAKYKSVMDQSDMRRQAIKDFMSKKGIPLEDVDIVMARGGLFTPVITGVYDVNQDMRDVLISCRDGLHACNLSAVLADDIARSRSISVTPTTRLSASTGSIRRSGSNG